MFRFNARNYSPGQVQAFLFRLQHDGVGYLLRAHALIFVHLKRVRQAHIQDIALRPTARYFRLLTLQMEINLQCQRCAACCRWPGEVRLSDVEVSQLANFLRLSENEFIESHTRLRKDRRGLALKAREDNSCIFLEENSCAVQAVKPEQCKEFPNRWVNLLWGKVPVEVMRRDYPMLFACEAFKDFLKRKM